MQAHRRRRAPHPARQVPRRAVRATLQPRRRPPEKRCCRPTATPRARGRRRSMVLLKNDGPVLPIRRGKTTAVIGPLGRQRGTTCSARGGAAATTRTPSRSFDGMKAQNPNATYTPGCTISHNELDDPADECATVDTPPRSPRPQAADQVVLALGETREMGGEAEARSNIDLPGKQQELIDAVKATGKPFAVVLFNVRPLTLTKVDAASPAILEAWFGGVEAGNARRRRPVRQGQPRRQAARVLPAQRRPGADLLQPRADRAPVRRDVRSTTRATATSARCAPLYEFGFGLSYTTFKVDNLRLSSPIDERRAAAITATVDVTNTGDGRGRRRRAALHPRPGRRALAAGAPPARVRAGDAQAG